MGGQLVAQMERQGVVVCGYYGFGNIGDEAVLSGLIWGLRQTGYQQPITVMSADVADTQRQHKVEGVERTDLPAIWRALRRAKTFVLGGGSLIQDVTSVRSPVYYLGMHWLARRAGCSTVWLGQGIGPVKRDWLRRWIHYEARRARAIVVRDRDSAQLLGESARVQVGADLAFLLPEAEATSGWLRLQKMGISRGKPLIGIAIRPWGGVSGEERIHYLLQRLIHEMVEQWQVQVLLIPMQPSRDVALCQKLAEVAGGKAQVFTDAAELNAVREVLACCQMLVGMRLHALILGAMSGVPALALSYDPKVRAFWSQLEPRYVVEMDGADQQLLRERAREIWTEREQLSQRVWAYAQEQRQLAWCNIHALREAVS